MNSFPSDFNNNLTGFGGDSSKNQTQHKAAIRKTPVVLVHGNGAHSAHPQWGYQQMTQFLKAIGYQDCEIWAMDYLGENNTRLHMPNPHTDHIDAFRTFVDRIRGYLGVDKLDFIAHSLGCGMVNAYLRGLRSDAEWNHEDNRLGIASTFVALAGATYGLGAFAQGEFRTGSPFEMESHKSNGVVDDTPAGSDDAFDQISPSLQWKKTTSLDDDGITYVAIIADDDFVDAQNQNTGRREGADLNMRINLGPSILGHERIIKDQTVFDAFKDYLNQHPPVTKPVIQVDRESGNYASNLEIGITVDPPDVSLDYTARRIQREFQAGTIQDIVAETDEGTLSSGQSLTLTTDGYWEVVFSAEGADNLKRVYGVNVVMPEVNILTDNQTPFQGSLKVMATTTKGILYHSLNGQHWNMGAILTITETATVYYIAIDSNGIASPVVQRAFEKKTIRERVTATLTEHFIAGRLSVFQYIDLGFMVGFTAVITLYLINDEWVYDPEIPERVIEAPTVHASIDSGTFNEPIRVTLSAKDTADPEPRIFYTLDGSQPTERSNSFASSGSLLFDTAGSKTLTYRARNASGNWLEPVTKTYGLEIEETKPRIHADKPSGEYAASFQVNLSVSDLTDSKITVYYTEDGSDPSNVHNPNRSAFTDSAQFGIEGNGNHSILCYAQNRDGYEAREAFAWCIDDQQYPETAISPSMGGLYGGGVEVKLSAAENCEWTKYTTDGTNPSDENGCVYQGPFKVAQTTQLKFCSKDTQGNLEPVKTARFTITQEPRHAVFSSQAANEGYVKANTDGSGSFVGTYPHLAIGTGWDGKDNRAILHFDTSPLPDNADITKANLELTYSSDTGDVWADGRSIEVDVQTGYLGTSQALQADDWNAQATTENTARVEKFTSETVRSTDFSQAGCNAINRTGVTQVRLKISPQHVTPNNYIFIKGEGKARLFIKYTV